MIDMSKLSVAKRIQILHLLVEGSSLRSISRVMKVSINTVTKLLVEGGAACLDYHDKTVRELSCTVVQCDEIWSFCYVKEKKVQSAKNAPIFAGDIWTWVTLCSSCKIIINWIVGGRDAEFAEYFMRDLASRVSNRIQISTDGHLPYIESVPEIFGIEVDFASIVKKYGNTKKKKGRGMAFSPVVCVGVNKVVRIGDPDEDLISTSHVERHNLSMRSHMKRYTRSTNAFSKKYENHCHALALYFVFYNFIRVHITLKTTPAVAAGIADKPYDIEWLLSLIDARAAKKGRPKK